MLIRSVGISVLAVLLLAGHAQAQGGNAVQLPSFQIFSVGTTVLVPDRGSAFMGGISYSSSGRNELGVPGLGRIPMLGRGFRNVGIGRNQSAGGMSTSVYIIDHGEMDRALLAEAARRRGAAFDVLGRPVNSAAGTMLAGDGSLRRCHGPGYVVRSPSSAERSVASRPQEPIRVHQGPLESVTSKAGRGALYLSKGRKAEAAGKPRVAKLFYQMASRRGSDAVRKSAVARLDAIGSGTSPSSAVGE